MPKTAALPADRAEAIALLTRALNERHAITLSLATAPRVIRAPPAVMACCLTFGMTPSEARVAVALMEHGYVGREDLHAAMSRDGKAASDITTVNVVVSRTRRKLTPYGIGIITVWGAGYRLDENDRDKLRKILAEYDAGAVATATPPAGQADRKKDVTE